MVHNDDVHHYNTQNRDILLCVFSFRVAEKKNRKCKFLSLGFDTKVLTAFRNNGEFSGV